MSFTPNTKFLSDDQLAQLHAAGIDILAKFGMKTEDSEVIDLFIANGCTAKDGRVFFPKDLIDKAVANLKQSVTFTSRTGNSCTLSVGTLHTHSTGGAPWIKDEETGKTKNATLDDLANCIRVMNGLSEMDLPCALVYPSEVAPEITQLVQMKTMFEFSHKPFYGPGVSVGSNAKYIAEMFKLFGGTAENPVCMVGVSPDSPLMFHKEITDTLKHLVTAGVPISILSAPMGGMTGPMTVLGTIAQMHAEILATTVLAYIINPACVMIYGSRTFFANMKTGETILGLPETGISSGIAAQLATYCGYMSDVYGLSCTSCVQDQQMGYEKMTNAMLPAMAGASMITGYGSHASVMAASLSQLVIDNEIVRMIKKAMQPYEINEDILGYEAIEGVIEDGTTFLEQPHTIEHLYTNEVFQPDISFASGMGVWVDSGEPELVAKAAKRAAEILANDKIIPFEAEIAVKMEELIAKAKAELL